MRVLFAAGQPVMAVDCGGVALVVAAACVVGSGEPEPVTLTAPYVDPSYCQTLCMFLV